VKLETEPEDLRRRLLAAMARRKGVDEREGLKMRPRSEPDLPDEPAGVGELADGVVASLPPAMARVYLDAIELRRADDARWVGLRAISASRSGRLTFVDVPLAGHQRIVADLSFGSQLAPGVSLRVFDQVTGGEIAGAEGEVIGQGRLRVMADLPGVFDLVCVELFVPAADSSAGNPIDLDLKRFIAD
jgi:hypothetical protein